jgi:peptidoglycan hydrolase-like protein with peptidoglycan-binding domain
MIFVNALFLQHGPHPAPLFATRPVVRYIPAAIPVALPPPRVPATAVAPQVPAPNRGQLITDIQRELSQRGFYDGAADGIWGAKTDAAVRDFVQAAGLRVNPEATGSLLRAIAATPASIHSQIAAPAPPPTDAIARMISPSKRVLAIQSALTEFGYGQIKPTGVEDADTRVAVEKFERDNQLPVTGTISEPLVRDLAAMTGRPLE